MATWLHLRTSQCSLSLTLLLHMPVCKVMEGMRLSVQRLSCSSRHYWLACPPLGMCTRGPVSLDSAKVCASSTCCAGASP